MHDVFGVDHELPLGCGGRLREAGRSRRELEHRGIAQVGPPPRRRSGFATSVSWGTKGAGAPMSAAAAWSPAPVTIARRTEACGEVGNLARGGAGVHRHEHDAAGAAGQPAGPATPACCRQHTSAGRQGGRRAPPAARAVRPRRPTVLRRSPIDARVAGESAAGRGSSRTIRSNRSRISLDVPSDGGRHHTVSPSATWRRGGSASRRRSSQAKSGPVISVVPIAIMHQDREQGRRDQPSLEADVEQDQLHHAARSSSASAMPAASRVRGAGQARGRPARPGLCQGRRRGTRPPSPPRARRC